MLCIIIIIIINYTFSKSFEQEKSFWYVFLQHWRNFWFWVYLQMIMLQAKCDPAAISTQLNSTQLNLDTERLFIGFHILWIECRVDESTLM